METISVRYIVDNVEAAIAFYTRNLDFGVESHPAPGFAILSRGDLRLLLNAPGAGGAGQAMPDGRKPALYAELHELLRPEGIFIRFDHVASATRWTESIWDDTMIEAIFGAELKGAPGKPRAEVARDYYRRVARSGSVPPPLEVEFDWLREAGFENVECFHKVQELAMFGGQKASARQKAD